MKIPIYQIDAFTDSVFSGNPAAVCLLEDWHDDGILQNIASENNLSETAFVVAVDGGYHIRWFTPIAEVDLCGHATLAASFVIFNYVDKSIDKITFESKSGKLNVDREGGKYAMDLPSLPPLPCKIPTEIVEGLGEMPVEVLRSDDYLVVFSNEDEVLKLKPDMDKLRKLDLRGVCVTARGGEVDFVSRFFAPKYGINEDPVTGSAHCTLIPYWAKKLNKESMLAHQISKRGGELFCKDMGNRVEIAGKAVKYLEGHINI